MLRLDLTPASPHTYLGPVPGAVGGSFIRADGPGLGCQMSWIPQETRVMGPPHPTPCQLLDVSQRPYPKSSQHLRC